MNFGVLPSTPPQQPLGRPFPAEVRGPGGERHTVYVRKHWSAARGEWLVDSAGNEYVSRLGGGIEPVKPPPVEPPAAVAPPITEPPAPAPAPNDGKPFRISVHGSGPMPEGVLVLRHSHANGGIVYVAADDSGRTFVPRDHGLSGAIEVAK